MFLTHNVHIVSQCILNFERPFASRECIDAVVGLMSDDTVNTMIRRMAKEGYLMPQSFDREICPLPSALRLYDVTPLGRIVLNLYAEEVELKEGYNWTVHARRVYQTVWYLQKEFKKNDGISA